MKIRPVEAELLHADEWKDRRDEASSHIDIDIFINCNWVVTQYIEQHNNLGECGPCPVLASCTLAFALQLRKKHGKTSVRVAASKNT